jgi:proline dehydrogenase
MSLPQFGDTATAFRHKSTAALRQAALLYTTMGSPTLTRLGIAFTSFALKAKLPIKGIIKKTIFRQFVGGENLPEAAQTAALLAPYKVGIVLDYGVEGARGEAAFDAAVPEFVKAIDFAASQPNVPFIAIKVTGFAEFTLLEKVHSGAALTTTETQAFNRVRNRVMTICEAAFRKGIRVLIDAEETWIQGPVDTLTNEAMERFNRERVIVYNTFQLYTHSRLAYLKESLDYAQQKGFLLGAKLVRGAYMEKERSRADTQGYLSPIQTHKEATDRDYDDAVHFCLDRLDQLAVFIGTHNEKSSLLGATLAEENGIPHNHPNLWFSQLYGMSDNITFNLAAAGYNVVKYLPYGPVEDVMPYLMRRAQENTSVKGQTGRELALIREELDRRAQTK